MSYVVRRRGAESKRELVARQVRSGLTVREFCHREGLNTWTFYGWRSQLRATTTVDEEPATRSAAAEEPASGFIDLGALRASSSRCEIRLDLGGGVVLQVVRG
jgi:transposase-like protein